MTTALPARSARHWVATSEPHGAQLSIERDASDGDWDQTLVLLRMVSDLARTLILIATFGSSCVLVFLLPDAPLSRPLNVVGGHFIAALCGLLAHTMFPTRWWSLGISVGVAMAAMALARVIHPPAGGTPIAILLTHETRRRGVRPVRE